MSLSSGNMAVTRQTSRNVQSFSSRQEVARRRSRKLLRIRAVQELEKPAARAEKATMAPADQFPPSPRRQSPAPMSSREMIWYEPEMKSGARPTRPGVVQRKKKDATPAANAPRSAGLAPLSSREMLWYEEDLKLSSCPLSPWPERRSWAQVVVDKAVDTLDDIVLIARRTLEPLPTVSSLQRFVRERGDTLRLAPTKKPVVLVLGSGWGAHSLIKVVDTEVYDVIVVSPRNHFFFTPMLPSTAVGTVEFRSLCDPIRCANPFVTYVEATCDMLDSQRKTALCTASVAYQSGKRPQFEINYDVLVVAVGERPATFNVPGVEEHCYFMKEIEDCVGLRKRISECFELAAMPGTSDEDRRRALHFVVVGGGPTGVEFAGTLSDFVRNDLCKKYPELMPLVQVTLLQSGQAILTQFSAQLQRRALENFERTGVEVRTGVRVVAVTQEQVCLQDGSRLDYGLCVWSAGNAPRPLVQSLSSSIGAQGAFASKQRGGAKLVVDPYLRVVGARDVLAIGDCALMEGNPLPATAQVAGQQGAYVARLINRRYQLREGGVMQPPPRRQRTLYGPLGIRPLEAKALEDSGGATGPRGALLSRDEAENAEDDVEYYRKPFEFLSLGIMAYIGDDKALTQIEAFDQEFKAWGGWAFLLWRSVYITKQVSLRNRVLILFDWLKARAFGRDLTQF